MNAVKIRCRDLMVGDWITDNTGFQWQITVVGDDYAYATFEGNEADPWEFDDKDDQPQPIEITEDIMRKNKWGVQGYCGLPDEHCCIIYVDKYILLWSPRALSIWFGHEHYDNGAIADIIIPCKYVHELQRALRLAGLKDMADNFKV